MKLQGSFFNYEDGMIYGRIYSKEAVYDIVNQFKNFEGPMYGTLNTPYGSITVNEEDFSHIILDVSVNEENKSFGGLIEVLDTSKGNILQTIISTGLVCSVFPRGEINSVDPSTGDVNISGLYTFDIVSDNVGISSLKIVDSSVDPSINSLDASIDSSLNV